MHFPEKLCEKRKGKTDFRGDFFDKLKCYNQVVERLNSVQML